MLQPSIVVSKVIKIRRAISCNNSIPSFGEVRAVVFFELRGEVAALEFCILLLFQTRDTNWEADNGD